MTLEIKNTISFKPVGKVIDKKRDRALFEAAEFIKDESNALAPVDTGNLRGTAYTQQSGLNAREIGYTAKYAKWVHEMVSQKLKGKPRENFGKTREGIEFGGGTGKGFYWDSGEPKFLEKALKANTTKVIKMMQRIMKL